ncbi:hypothetical protein PFICI_12339 [Pestalotiopsis fici W106-1]|uniref:Uncharacterized protein n=1 Tax=Pestalotiopsis fici (strain W106-1 / CGMCC3.15140) TaxID=1229662 RepID=W3WNA2_PESFW|nr:uncharacterized protein PFICI_12339 [Pestalotiopsis fici W106-1]ETS75395.1 hypothetical protein PFICI_12339 [Pestalotiopsis fici W106-1]
MRPHTPIINTARTEPNVTSPPETPTTTGSPSFNRKFGAASVDPKHGRGRLRHSSIPPLGGVGSQFNNHTLGIRPEDISPRSSKSSDDESEKSASPSHSPRPNIYGTGFSQFISTSSTHAHTSTVVVEAAFEIEECSDEDEDAMDSGDEYEDVRRPDSYEYPDSDRGSSRPHSRSALHEVDSKLMDSFLDLKTCYSSDDDSELELDEFEIKKRALRQEKRLRRMTSGSIGKRTVSERGSDSDREDLQPWDTGDSSLRRLRRKVNRRSLLSDIIIELKEPNSDGEVVWDEDEINLARELPFWTMEVDSD